MHPSAFTSRTTVSIVAVLLALTIEVPCASGSTQAGEMTITAVDADRRSMEADITFMEYFSGAREWWPGARYSSEKMKDGAWQVGYTMFFIDGRLVKTDVAVKALRPGLPIYHYGSRHTPEFIAFNSHAVPVKGILHELKGDAMIVRRLMVRSDINGASYLVRTVALDEHARYRLNGKPAPRDEALKPGRLVRVLPSQTQIISAFSPDALDEPTNYSDQHAKSIIGYWQEAVAREDQRQGRIIEAAKVLQGSVDQKQLLTKSLDRKGYTIIDGQYTWSRSMLEVPGQRTVFFCYRGSDKAKYILARSDAVQAWDGVIDAADGPTIRCRTHPQDDEKIVKVADDALVLLNGCESKGADALKTDHVITVYEKRPMVVDVWDAGEASREGYMIVEYDEQGCRRVVEDGYHPIFDEREKDAMPGIHGPEEAWEQAKRDGRKMGQYRAPGDTR